MSYIKKIIFLPFNVKEKSLEEVFKISFLLLTFFHLWAAFLTEGFHRPDEHLGIVRMMQHALRQLDATNLSWEFPAQIRAWAQPFFYACIAKIYYFFGVKSPFALMAILRLASSVLALFSLYYFMRSICLLYKEDIDKKLAISLFPFIWYLPFFHARTSTEKISSSLALTVLAGLIQLGVSNTRKYFLPTILGILAAFSFYARLQMASSLLPAVLAFPFIYRQKKIEFALILFGGIFGLLINYYLDFKGYGSWTITPWNNLYHNLFKGVASGFGTDPFYTYFTKGLLRAIPPVSLFYFAIIFIFWYLNPKSLLTWSTLPFFLAHSLIAHKEIRFIYYLGQFIPAMAPAFFNFLQSRKLSEKLMLKGLGLAKISLLMSVALIMYSSSRNAYSHLGIYKSVYKMENPPQKIYTLNVIRDVLEIYLPEKIEFIYLDQIPEKIETERFFIMDSYFDWEKINFSFRCKIIDSEFTELLFPIYPGLKKSKDWIFAKCVE